MQAFNFDVEFVKGENNIADTPSRLANSEDNFEENSKVFVNAVEWNKFVTKETLIEESRKDNEIIQVKAAIETGNWTGVSRPFRLIKEEISSDGDLLYKNFVVIMPTKLRSEVLKLAHITHSGMVCMKRMLRERTWWPKMNEDVEKLVSRCGECQFLTPNTKKVPLKFKTPLSEPWEEVAVDFMDAAGYKLFVLVDYYTRYVMIAVMKDATTEKLIEELEKMLAIWYYPKFNFPFFCFFFFFHFTFNF